MAISLPTKLMQRLGIELPIIQAPMVGASSIDMAVAAANAGGLGSFAVGTLHPVAIESSVASLRGRTAKPVNINMFVLGSAQPSAQQLQDAFALLNPIRAELGLQAATPLPQYCENFRDQLEVVIALKLPIVSFTFDVLDAASIERLHNSGSLVIGTATNVAEALAWEANGADVICAQGTEAGGHRGSFIGGRDEGLIGTMALVPQIVDAVKIPVIAAGGIMDGRGIHAALALGAQAAQLGTAFLRCKESVCSAPWQQMLKSAKDTSTGVTRAFSGRYARGIVNDYMKRMQSHEQDIAPYPIQNALTGEIRQAAAKQNRPEFLSLWAGQGAGLARNWRDGMSTEELIQRLSQQLQKSMS